MIVLCAIWGLQQVAIKVTAQDVAPVMQIAIRSGLAAALVGVVLMLGKGRVDVRSTWRAGLGVGTLFALEFLAVGEGLRHTSASHMVIFLYTAPIFAAIGLHYRFPNERLKLLQWGGILLAFAGVAVAFHAPAAPGVDVAEQRVGDVLALLGAVAWGATTLTVRCTVLAESPAPLTLFYQLFGALVILMLAAWLSGQMQVQWSSTALLSLGFQTLVVGFFSLLAWFWLLGRYLGSRLGVLSFLTPLFGVGFGSWLLGERLQLPFVIGSLMVLGGIVLVSGHDLLFGAKNRAQA